MRAMATSSGPSAAAPSTLRSRMAGAFTSPATARSTASSRRAPRRLSQLPEVVEEGIRSRLVELEGREPVALVRRVDAVLGQREAADDRLDAALGQRRQDRDRPARA